MLTGIHAILGHKGSGKSRLARAIIAPSKKLVVIDTLGEHAALAERVTVEQLTTALAAKPEAYRFSIRPVDYSEVEWMERVAAARPGCCIFIDEIDFWYTDCRAVIGPGLNALVRYGRHYDQSVVAVARRPADMSRTVTSQATLWCFPMMEPRDRAYVQQFSSLDPGTLRVIEERGEHIIRTEVSRSGIRRGVEVGEFNLVTGQYWFPTADSEPHIPESQETPSTDDTDPPVIQEGPSETDESFSPETP